MNQHEWGRSDLSNSDQRRRGVARVVPLPDQDNDEGMAFIVLVFSASIALVASTLATTLF